MFEVTFHPSSSLTSDYASGRVENKLTIMINPCNYTNSPFLSRCLSLYSLSLSKSLVVNISESCNPCGAQSAVNNGCNWPAVISDSAF